MISLRGFNQTNLKIDSLRAVKGQYPPLLPNVSSSPVLGTFLAWIWVSKPTFEPPFVLSQHPLKILQNVKPSNNDAKNRGSLDYWDVCTPILSMWYTVCLPLHVYMYQMNVLNTICVKWHPVSCGGSHGWNSRSWSFWRPRSAVFQADESMSRSVMGLLARTGDSGNPWPYKLFAFAGFWDPGLGFGATCAVKVYETCLVAPPTWNAMDANHDIKLLPTWVYLYGAQIQGYHVFLIAS